MYFWTFRCLFLVKKKKPSFQGHVLLQRQRWILLLRRETVSLLYEIEGEDPETPIGELHESSLIGN